MAVNYNPIPNQDLAYRAIIQDLTGGWSTRTAPHMMLDNYLYKADNVVYYQDGLVSKRPGNVYYGEANTTTSLTSGYSLGRTGTEMLSGGQPGQQSIDSLPGFPINSMTRFYQPGEAPALLVQSNSKLYQGNDTYGTFMVAISGGLAPNTPCSYTQMYDPDSPLGAGTMLFICDGISIPKVYNGTTFVGVHTGLQPVVPLGVPNWLPNDPERNPITPKYCCDWQFHLAYAGQYNDPGALYISDALRPESFNGFANVDSSGLPYIAYYPDARDGTIGEITGLVVIGPYLVIFYTAGIVTAINTGSYAATQYQFVRISNRTGCVSPQSIIPMGGYVAFYGGDGFYATDGQNLWKLPDELPTVYTGSGQATRQPLIQNQATVFGVRHNDLMIWSFTGINSSTNNQCVVFDEGAQGGWSPGQSRGGAWALWPSGMPIGAAVDCRGPGDNFQMYWGASNADIVAQFDVATTTVAISGNYADFGLPIAMELQTKALYFDNPASKKLAQGMYLMVYIEALATGYELYVNPYIIGDLSQVNAAIPTNMVASLEYGTDSSGVYYGEALYRGVNSPIKVYYEAANKGFFQSTEKAFFNNAISQSWQPGVKETSTYPFSVMGMILECIVDEPQP